MPVTLPSINIKFRQLASSFISRSERGVALIIIRDATEGGNGFATYTQANELADAPYSAENKQYIKDALAFGPYEVGVAKIGADDTVADGLALITANAHTGWITVADGTEEDWAALVAWIKAGEEKVRSWKAVVYNAETPDSMHIVNLVNANVTYADDRGQKAGGTFTPGLAGLLASCNINRSATSMVCPMLKTVTVPDDPDAAVAAGKFILILDDDDKVRVGVDVNSLTTLDGDEKTEDMQYIETVEIMDLIRDDITRTFASEYRGKYRNSLTNQMLLISAINDYFRQLSSPSVGALDESYDNKAGIDAESQRAAWIAAGKTEAQDWSDAEVRSRPYRRDVYLLDDIKILGSMTSLQMIITLY